MDIQANVDCTLQKSMCSIHKIIGVYKMNLNNLTSLCEKFVKDRKVKLSS